MDFPFPEPEPRPALVRHDRLASAIGNASLLGVGYLLQGRRAWAFGTTLITVLLMILLGTAVREVWFEVFFLVWWVGLVAHGWYLAGKLSRSARVRWPRTIALVITVPVLVGIGYVRFDAADIDNGINAARDSGDCDQARSTVDRIWAGHYVVDGPMTVRAERTAAACDQLREAGVALQGGASRLDTDDLRSGYQDMDGVLRAMPGHDKMVDTVLDGFLSSVPSRDPCAVTTLTDWLRQRPATRNLLDRSADIVPKLAPLALLDCGDQRASRADWAGAQVLYQQMVNQYPGHELTERAQRGLKQAKEGLELQHLTSLSSRYCETPAVYSAAPPYAKGATDPAVVYPTNTYDEYVKRLPGEWQADNSHATMVVCVGQRDSGASVRTCRYREDVSGRVRNVTFTKIAYPVRAYELRTGNVVFDGTVQVGGAACPAVITLFESDTVYVDPADSDIRAAFAPVFTP